MLQKMGMEFEEDFKGSQLSCTMVLKVKNSGKDGNSDTAEKTKTLFAKPLQMH